jgi:hypothetical protein
MNDKQAKLLRKAAGYRNQSATPGIIPFPGIARFYLHPVVSKRPAVRTSYVRLPLDSALTKVKTKVYSVVQFRRNQPVWEMEMTPVFEPTLDEHGQQVYDSNGQPATHPVLRDGQPVMQPRIKQAQIPVTKPARLDPRCPKGVYRSLKRLARRGLTGARLLEAGIAASAKEQEAHT